ncbi:TonB-dependent receptor [Stakelama sediminis]|uniref:TonB-dependent receptor n=1 Tax=Stakelama sediminis TaxID=463200 RepID=A0A840Z0E5_9SPHN|nr:TonB-dependent receptor [Stakelama sediminis]MBB5719192.1 TonB-dependent receptor [Stakelama sediminis]
MAFRTYRTTTSMLAVALAMTSTVAMAQTQQSQPAKSSDTQPTGTSDTALADQASKDIVIVGIRGSLDKSVQVKRDAAVVLDSVNATELGRFPDSDVADSLQHITGITINRTTGGEGQYVSVRGLGSQYNITTLNGRILATDDDGRDFAFDILPADVISGADVLKSPQASAVEGSIGGTVNLRSARPFDHPGFHMALRAEGNYNDMSEYGGFKVSGFVSKTNAAETLGLLVGVVYSDEKFRTDALNYSTWDPDNPGVWPPAPTDSSDPPANAQAVNGLCCIQFGSVVDRKKRFAVTSTLEWKPTDTLHVTVDGMYTKLTDPQVAYNQSYYPDFTYDANGLPEWSDVTVKNGFITQFTANNFDPEIVNQTIHRVVDTYLVGLNADWEASSNLTLRTDIYRSHANRPEGGTDTFLTAGLVSPTPYNQNIMHFSANPNEMPNISVTLPDGTDYATALASGQLDNQSLWSTHYDGLSGDTITDTVTGAKLDATYSVDNSFLKHIDAGFSYQKRSKSRRDISNDWTNGSNQYSTLYNTMPGQPGPITFATMGQNVISTFNFPNYFAGAGGSFPTTQVLINAQALLDGLKSLDGTPNYTSGEGVYNFADTLPQFNPTNSYAVTEETFAGYIEASFGGPHWSGNIGVRLVHTNTTAKTAVNKIISVTVADTANPTSAGITEYSDATPLVAHGNYTIPLPAANVNFGLTDNLHLRLAVAQTMARPNLNQFAPTETDDTSDQNYVVYYDGNADLKPIKAWQADASLEWYYHRNDMVSVAIFGKKLRGDITTIERNNVDIGAVGCFNGNPCQPLLFSVVEPINGDTSKIYGIELSWQHMLNNGFGIRAQFTHTWSHASVDGVDVGSVAGVSPTTFSINPFYEHGPVSLSVSWDHSSSFTYSNYTEIDGVPAIAKAYDWVTATASYDITKRIKVYVEGRNLTNSIVRTYLNGDPNIIWASGAVGTSSSVGAGYTAYGRTYTAGIRFGF